MHLVGLLLLLLLLINMVLLSVDLHWPSGQLVHLLMTIVYHIECLVVLVAGRSMAMLLLLLL